MAQQQIKQQYAGPRNDDWQTPHQLFADLDREFGFAIDVAADYHNHLCRRWYDRQHDGLLQDWSNEVVWCNPPYGQHVAAWVTKAAQSAAVGATVVMLLFARVDVRWFHDIVYRHAAEVRFIRGRVQFERGQARHRSPYPSMLVVFRPRVSGPPQMLIQGDQQATQEVLL